MKNIFTEHPNSLGETYLQHMKFALVLGFNMIMGSLTLLIHGIFPFLFIKTGSNFLLKTIHLFIERVPATENRIVQLSEKLEKKLFINKQG